MASFNKVHVKKLYLPDAHATKKAFGRKMTQVTATASELNIMDGVTATATEINAAADVSAQAAVSAGAGITGGTGTVFKSAVIPQGDFTLTKIYVDVTGLSSVATDLDVIGNDIATDLPAYLGQITAAVNGTIVGGQMTCLEVPTTGADDVDLYAADDADQVVSDASTGFTNGAALVTAGGAWTLMLTKPFIAYPAADQYLYLLSGEAAAGEYDAGRFLIELWGI
jgi:hypothetical protein